MKKYSWETFLILVFSFLLPVGFAHCGDQILAEDYPKLAIRIPHFETRINSSDKSVRLRVLVEAGYFDITPDKEYVKFLKRMIKDPDSLIRGRAIQQLHNRWIPLKISELPDIFSGYHNDQLIERASKKTVERLLEECKSSSVEAGYAAYVLGLLKIKEAIPFLKKLNSHNNIFVRYAGGRALFDCGEKEEAEKIFKDISQEQLELYRTGKNVIETGNDVYPTESLADPYYATVACRGLIEIGGKSKQMGIKRLIDLMGYLEDSKNVNDQTSIHHVRDTLAVVTGKYFISSKDAKKWAKQNKIE